MNITVENVNVTKATKFEEKSMKFSLTKRYFSKFQFLNESDP